MYARLTMFTLGPAARAKAEELADAFAPQMRARKGVKSVTFFMDESAGEYGAFTLYETKDDADASVAALDSRLQEVLRGIAKGPPTLRGFDVYEPRT